MAYHSGIGRYIRSLTRALVQSPGGPGLSLLRGSGEPAPDWLDPGAVRVLPFDAEIYTLKEQWAGSRIARQGAKEGALLHFPHYNSPWFLPPGSVLTVHDLTHLLFPEFYPERRVRAARVVLSRAVKRAGRIVAVSGATRDELVKLFPDSENRTVVVHHGVDRSFRPSDAGQIERFRREQGLGRYFLYVGNRKPHKNLGRLLRAFTRLRHSFGDVELVLAGASPWPEPPPAGTRVLSDVDDEMLVRWYGAAEALLLPSLSEGFGMTALEAMACAVPVIGSEIAAISEVTGEAGLLVDPLDEQALAAAMSRLLEDGELRAELSRRSRARAAEFTWEKCAAQTMEVYRTVAGLAVAAGGPDN